MLRAVADRPARNWARRIGLAACIGLSILAVRGASAGALAASSAFCADTAQLQSWIAQGFTPGIDQFTSHPNATSVQSEAAYLQKLAEEAPASEAPDLRTWATFTHDVAVGASQAALARQEPAAKAAASRVRSWLATRSACPHDYTTSALPVHHAGSHKVLYSILGVIGAIVVLAVLSLFAGGASGGSRMPSRRTSSGGSTVGTAKGETCRTCNGSREVPHGPCQGRGVIDHNTPSAYEPYRTTDSRCSGCGGRGKVPCGSCGGSGYR